MLRIEVDREALSRYGVPARQVLDAITAAGGIKVGEVLEPGRRFPLVVRLPAVLPRRPARPSRRSSSRPRPASGSRSPGSPSWRRPTGPSTIQREWGERRIVVQANVRGRDIGSFVEEAQERDRDARSSSPTGYTIEWGGQFENMQRAEKRLFIVVPLALALILSLLYLTFHSLRDALMIFSGVLFARVGGVLGLWRHGPAVHHLGGRRLRRPGRGVDARRARSSSAAIRDRMAHGMPKREAIEQARLARLRPVLMTGHGRGPRVSCR